MRLRNLLLASLTGCCLLSSLPASAAPTSDGSISYETFTTYPESGYSSTPGAVDTSGGNAHIVTTTGTEAVYRVSTLNLTPGTEYVLEYDFSINAESGDNFYVLFMQGSSSPWDSGIAMRAYGTGSTYAIQVDYASGGYDTLGSKVYGQTYHATVHHKTDNTLDLYLDDLLVNTYAERNPSLGTSLIQFGDSSTGSGFGDLMVDNVSLGGVAAVPEPASIGLGVMLGGALLLNRRRQLV